MKRDYNLFLDDIVESIRHIEDFIYGFTYERFCKDEKTLSAVIRKLEVIGEASKQIPQSFKDQYPDLPWTEMARMRDKLIHGYFGVNPEIIWRVIRERLPEIGKQIETSLS